MSTVNRFAMVKPARGKMHVTFQQLSEGNTTVCGRRMARGWRWKKMRMLLFFKSSVSCDRCRKML